MYGHLPNPLLEQLQSLAAQLTVTWTPRLCVIQRQFWNNYWQKPRANYLMASSTELENL